MQLTTSYTKCPKCEAKYCYTDRVSGDTIGAESWSDEFFIAPTLKHVNKFAKCEACSTFFWLEDNSIKKSGDFSEIKNIDDLFSFDNQENTEIDFIKEAFRSGLASTSEKEIFLRIRMWQVINNIIRPYAAQDILDKIKQKFFKTPEFKEAMKEYNSHYTMKRNNLIRLSNLLKSDKTENTNYLLFAEIYRESGDFNRAMIFCYKAETSTHADVNRISLLKQHIQNKNKMVYKI